MDAKAVRFHLVSEWHIAATPEAVWGLLANLDAWPQWWPEVRRVQNLPVEGSRNTHARRRTWWISRLPYGFVIDFVTLAAQNPDSIFVAASGDLVGTGHWEISAIPVGARVRYTWQVYKVHPRKAWMRWMAPMLAPLFRWNHHAVMHDGADGMARQLGVELIDFHAMRACKP